jgi:micrococcal nuclease
MHFSIVIELSVKQKIILGLLMGLMVFLFLGIKFSKVEKADVKVNNYEWLEVVKVVDGDTIELKIGENTESVRLIGIDAPEIEGKTKEKGIESKNYLKSLIGTEKVRLEADETQDDRDIYDRLLRYVFLKNGKMINKIMIETKMAKEYTFRTKYKYQEEFRKIGR